MASGDAHSAWLNHVECCRVTQEPLSSVAPTVDRPARDASLRQFWSDGASPGSSDGDPGYSPGRIEPRSERTERNGRGSPAAGSTRTQAAVRSSMLRRRALEDRLDGAFAKRLTTVVAGAGFGKSTLLAAWADELESAWYSITAKDTALPWLERGVARAIATRVPDATPVADTAFALGAAIQDELLHADAFAALLCETLGGALTHDLVLVLDDVHELTPSPAAVRLVESLCRQAAPALHAELASSLHELTGGRPALVRLALEALSVVEADDRVATLEGLRRPGGSVFAYLAEEIFANEPAAVRELVRTVALLEFFTPGMCEALGLDGAAETVDDLARRGLFVERREIGYVLHSLAREFALRAWPFESGEAADVRRRAARWLESNGYVEHALRPLAAARDTRELRRMLAERGAALVAAGATTSVVAAAELVREDFRDATIDALAGEAYTVKGDHERALVCFARAAGTDALIPPALAWRMVQAHSLRDELDEALAVHGRGEPGSADTADEALLLAWTASVQRRRGEFETARELAARALAAANASGDDRAIAAAHTAAALVAPADRDAGGRDGHLTQALDAAERAHDVLQVIRIRNNRASNQLEEGRYESAIDELDATIDLAELVGFVGLLALALMNRGLARWCLGRLDEAGADYEAAAVHYRKAGSREISYAIIGQGDVYRERGNLAMARACYEEGLTLAERSGDLQGLVPALYQLAKVLVDEQPERATRAAERAVAYGWPDPAWALNAAGWVALAHGDRERAAATAAQAPAAAHEERDRFGLAESLELEGAATDGPTRAQTLYEEALSTWRALGNPIHEAAVELALAGVAPGPATAAARERAERKLRTLGVRVSSTGPAGLLRHVADAPAIPVRIEALGGFSVQRAGRPIRLEEWRSRKARDLLKILVARRRRPAPREFLMEALWPDDDATKLGNRLSVALSTLRAVLDPEKRFDADHFLRADKNAVLLENVATDVETFLEEAAAGLSLRERGRANDATERLEHAEAIYAGDFLEEDPYEDWAVALREEARTAYVRVTRALAEDTAAAGDDAGAAAYLLRILARDAYDEQAHLDLVGVLASGRRHGEARRAYRMYAERMAEIGVEPGTFPALTA